jgi:hypothetical protein
MSDKQTTTEDLTGMSKDSCAHSRGRALGKIVCLPVAVAVRNRRMARGIYVDEARHVAHDTSARLSHCQSLRGPRADFC